MTEFPADIEYTERGGDGPALLLLPGSFGTGSSWRSVIDLLPQDFRFVTTSLIGYGATAERRPSVNPTMQQQTEVIDLVLDRIGAPTHVVGHSFGGFAALAHATDGKIKPASLTLIEANPFGILRTAAEPDLYAMFGAMTRVYFAAFEAGEPDAARHVIDYYGGAGTFAAFPQKVRDYVIRTTATNIRDWAAATAYEPPLASYAAISAPTVVVRGGDGHPAMLRIAELLAETVPGARLETVVGGSHFLPATHAGEVAGVIGGNVSA